MTVHFKDGNGIKLSFEDFKSQYTLTPEEAERCEQEHRRAFPDVSHAIVEYPLPLLEKGVEIVDSPGLNDTQELDDRSLSYLKPFCKSLNLPS